MNFTALFFALAAALPAHSAPIPPREQVYNNTRLPGGAGYDKQILQLRGNQEDFDNGVYFLRIDVAQRKLTNYRLPAVTFTNYCGHYRASGGSIGDYKPKSIYRTLKVFDEANGNRLETLYWFGRAGQDYNETPVVYTMNEFHPRGTQLSIASDSHLMAILIQRCRHVRPYPWVRMQWQTAHSCRWKPEIWHKPNLWRDEYAAPLNVMDTKTVVLHCVNM